MMSGAEQRKRTGRKSGCGGGGGGGGGKVVP